MNDILKKSSPYNYWTNVNNLFKLARTKNLTPSDMQSIENNLYIRNKKGESLLIYLYLQKYNFKLLKSLRYISLSKDDIKYIFEKINYKNLTIDKAKNILDIFAKYEDIDIVPYQRLLIESLFMNPSKGSRFDISTLNTTTYQIYTLNYYDKKRDIINIEILKYALDKGLLMKDLCKCFKDNHFNIANYSLNIDTIKWFDENFSMYWEGGSQPLIESYFIRILNCSNNKFMCNLNYINYIELFDYIISKDKNIKDIHNIPISIIQNVIKEFYKIKETYIKRLFFNLFRVFRYYFINNLKQKIIFNIPNKDPCIKDKILLIGLFLSGGLKKLHLELIRGFTLTLSDIKSVLLNGDTYNIMPVNKYNHGLYNAYRYHKYIFYFKKDFNKFFNNGRYEGYNNHCKNKILLTEEECQKEKDAMIKYISNICHKVLYNNKNKFTEDEYNEKKKYIKSYIKSL